MAMFGSLITVEGGKGLANFFRMTSTRFQTLPMHVHTYRYPPPNLVFFMTVRRDIFSTTASQKTEIRSCYKSNRSPSPFRHDRERGNGDNGIENNAKCSSCNSFYGGSGDDNDRGSNSVVRPYSGSLPSPGHEWCKRCNIPDKRFQMKIGSTNKCLDRPRIFGLGICHEAKQYYRQQLENIGNSLRVRE
ncbi:unnamed protein product [Pseudo-nitzschia multistriata]|uniref:Uncharacterized protein n=1 Tax=Pseudo-nitzschia multistriata TaxID=183589 RepID=A0A448ZIH8_9STRA|nr:unnamed protein product [Pseudo-nitzschia multistriata]